MKVINTPKNWFSPVSRLQKRTWLIVWVWGVILGSSSGLYAQSSASGYICSGEDGAVTLT